MKNNLLLVSFCAAFLGYGMGWVFGPVNEQPAVVDLSSTEVSPSEKTSYDKLPCPSEADYRSLAATVNLTIPEGPSLDQKCDGSHRALLGKALLLLSSFQFNFPQQWPETLKDNLGNPLLFLKNRSSKLTLDLNQTDSVAYNKVLDKEIYLGGQFFSLGPLEGAAVLVHEARHSDPQANSHVFCEAGDIPRSEGACDARFSIEDDAGAYAYGTLFNVALALYAKNISVPDREFAMAEALLELGARFNVLPDVYARKSDILVVLTDSNQLLLVHPETGATKEIKISFESKEEHAERIEFSPAGNGLQIFSSRHRVIRWNPLNGSSPLYAELFPASVPVYDLFRMRVPFNTITSNVVRLDNNTLEYMAYSAEKMKTVRNAYPYRSGRQKSLPQAPFHRMFLALSDESVFLTTDGNLYLAPHFGDGEVFGEVATLKSPQGWIGGTGGVLYDSLYLIDSRGDLHYATTSETLNEDGSIRTYDIANSLLQHPQPLKKFAQGLEVQMGLTRQGDMVVWNYGDDGSEYHLLPLKHRIRDFVITQVVDLDSRVGKNTPAHTPFIRKKGSRTSPYSFR